MMLDHLGWGEAAEAVRKGLIGAVQKKKVTYDLARQMAGAEEVSCSAFAAVAVESM
jgi:isocitrate dehydrogenase